MLDAEHDGSVLSGNSAGDGSLVLRAYYERIGQIGSGAAGYGFPDVEPGDWCASTGILAYAINNGLIKGNADGTFRTYENISRAQVAVILHRMAGEHAVESVPFDDVDFINIL